MSPEDLRAWIRLTKLGASARRTNRLLDYFGGPQALFQASIREIVQVLSCSQSVAERILDPDYAATDRELTLMDRLGVHLICRSDPEYPPLLQQIFDPPPALYVRGQLTEADRSCVGIVGSRRATDYGKRSAEELARGLVAAGYVVTSGLARGVDTAAHIAALRAGGRTLACLGCGVDVAYPYENRELANAIAAGGALLSEYPMTAPPDAWHFPSRNRIISGLSLGVVVIEAPIGSGALITAECAVEHNREVFAVPGNIQNFRNKGAHALIRDGAKLVETAEDILVELQPAATIQGELPLDPVPARPELTPQEATVLALLDGDPAAIDDLILEAGMPASAVSGALLTMEIKGVVRRLPGNAYVKLT